MSENSGIDDSVTSNLSYSEKKHQTIIPIRGRLVLDYMLEHFGMPVAHYKQEIRPDNRIYVTITFQTPSLSCHGSPNVISTFGVESLDGALAEHTAAVSAIRIIETTTDTVIGDASYGQLRKVDKENTRLKREVELSKQLFKHMNIKTKKLARVWFWSVRRMFSFSSQFHNVAIIANFGAQEPLNDDVRASFATIYESALQME